MGIQESHGGEEVGRRYVCIMAVCSRCVRGTHREAPRCGLADMVEGIGQKHGDIVLFVCRLVSGCQKVGRNGGVCMTVSIQQRQGQ